ncbi:NAD(P)-dependent oxidoreductase [Micromonospora sagamiensis]|uniref:D-3-phosphoglycerate dehydrogenase n=1 Tax=Micromonospora sagamiensis TaxID=47875 RepID=A0A562WE05_9ACTN|nr:NAD(P)-dependent oxidoreductase [Micromonospora sagamiensis]TWJ28408.1 D-3-phosphoglycerate dehydrogenase [Micromonospora sagamiensis]BCL12700.1 oxidoreductase [Micromonospora sagamiensis]
MTAPRILVTPRSMSVPDSPAVRRLRSAGFTVVTPTPGRQPTGADLAATVPGVVGWIAGVESIDADVLARADALKVISRNGAGRDAIDATAADAAGVQVLTARGANAQGVAELALALTLMGLRGLPEASAALRAGQWRRGTGREAAGRTLGVVGFGAIGRRLAGLARGLGMRVVAHDPFVTDGGDVPLLPLADLLRSSEVVSLHVPPSPDGPLLGSAELALLRDDVVLVNTARSTLVDEVALLAALESGRIALYSVDAFDREPPEPSALLAHPRVAPTPHLGAATTESVRRASDAAVDNLLAALTALGIRGT